MPQLPRPASARPDLSRACIVAAALDLVRAEGIEALTMRRLAERLGSGAMSLYRHVADRRALLVAMLDAVAQGIEVPVRDDPAAEIEAILLAIHGLFRSDPWLVRVLIFEGLESLNILPLIERVLTALAALGLTPDRAVLVYATLIQHAYGEALDTAHARDPARLERVRQAIGAGGFPHLDCALRTAGAQDTDRYPAQLRALIRGLT